MPPATPLTKGAILDAISRLQLQAGRLLRQVSTSDATDRRRDDARALTGILTTRLSEAAADVSDAADDQAAGVAWNNWAQDSIIPRLADLAALLGPLDTKGVCTYPNPNGGTFQACLYQSQCDNIPNSSFSAGGC